MSMAADDGRYWTPPEGVLRDWSTMAAMERRQHEAMNDPKRASRDYHENREWWDGHIAWISRERAHSVRRALQLPAVDPVAEAVKLRMDRVKRGGTL